MTGTASYRKTQTGEWVVMGPTSIVKANATVTVAKKDGSTKVETIAKVGRPFQAQGREMVYGYIARSAWSTTGTRPARNQYGQHRECDECGELATPGTVCWETGLRH